MFYLRIFSGIKIVLLCLLLLTVLSACSTTGGFLGGGNWQSSGLPHQHIRVLAVDAKNAQNVFAGDAQGSIFASTDGGQHWAQLPTDLPLPNSVHALSFDASNKKFYAATDTGLFVSADRAYHWNKVGQIGQAANEGGQLPSDSYTSLAFDFKAPYAVYVGTFHHGIFKSTDSGKSWTFISKDIPSASSINALAFDSSTHQLWAATTNGVYSTGDAGQTWQALNNGFPVHSNVVTVQPAIGNDNHVFAGTNQSFFYSSDKGMHWTRSDVLARVGIYTILVDFRQSTTIYVGTALGAFGSNDSGKTWQGIAPGLPKNQPAYALQLGASDYSQLIAATNDIYIFPGTSGGLTLGRLIPFLFILLFFFLLYRIVIRSRRKRSTMLKPGRIIEQPPAQRKEEQG